MTAVDGTREAKRRVGGRPPKSPDEVLSAPLQVRLTVADRAALEEKANRTGCSVTDLVRSAVREVVYR